MFWILAVISLFTAKYGLNLGEPHLLCVLIPEFLPGIVHPNNKWNIENKNTFDQNYTINLI